MDQEQLRQSIDTMTQITDLLYQGNVEYAYKMLGLTVVELDHIISSVTEEEIREELKTKLMEALGAMENADHVLLADIFQYEIIESLKRLLNE